LNVKPGGQEDRIYQPREGVAFTIAGICGAV